MSESMVRFLSIAVENGCIGSTFAEDNERIIVYTRWSDERTLEKFRSSTEYHTQERKIIQSFSDAGFEIPNDILFNSTAKILFRVWSKSFAKQFDSSNFLIELLRIFLGKYVRRYDIDWIMV